MNHGFSYCVTKINVHLAVLLNGSSIFIEILPSDDALGTFSLIEKFIKAEEGTEFNVTINRVGGALDDVNVMWRVVNGTGEFEPSYGSVMVPYRTLRSSFMVKVIEDKVEQYYVLRTLMKKLEKL